MDHPKAGICVLWLMGVATAQTSAAGSNKTNAGGNGDTHKQPGTA